MIISASELADFLQQTIQIASTITGLCDYCFRKIIQVKNSAGVKVR